VIELDVLKIPLADGAHNRLEQRVFADLGRTTEHERVVDLVTWALHPAR
jgi:hypothetical protein